MIAEFFERFPKCGEFAEIFEWLRSLEVSADVAADVAKSLLWASGKSAKQDGGGKPGRPAALSADQVEQVQALHKEWAKTQTAFTKAAAKRFGVSEETIRLAVKKQGVKKP